MFGDMAYIEHTDPSAVGTDLNAVTSNQSCDIYIYKEVAQVLFPIFYTLVFLVSVLGNSLVLYITCHREQKFNSTSLYLVNLALSDTLFSLALPGRITYYILEYDWPFGDLLCRLTAVIFYTNTYAGIAFMTCVSLDRYLAMVHPHRLLCLRKVGVVRGVCALVWLLVFVMMAPLLFRNMLGNNRGKRTCMEYHSFEGFCFLPHLLLLGCAVGFCVPLGIILGCYTQIKLKLSRAARRNPVSSRSGRSHRANSIILLILFTFVVCFSPYHVNIMQFMVRRLIHKPSCQEMKAFKMSLQVTVSLMNLNCCLDPFIYIFAINSYKQRVMNLFRGHQSTSNPSPKTLSVNSSNKT